MKKSNLTMWLRLGTVMLLSFGGLAHADTETVVAVQPPESQPASALDTKTNDSAPAKPAKTSKPSLASKIQPTSNRTPGTETIYTALKSAYENNPELALEITKVNQADERMPQAKAGFRPTVTGNVKVEANQTNKSGDFKRLGVDTTANSSTLPGAQAGIEVKQNLYAGGATVASIKGAEQNIKAARARLLVVEQQVFLQVIQVILEILLKQSELDLYEGNIKLLQRTLDATTQRFDVGEETRTAVAQAEAQLAAGDAQYETAKGELEGLKATFKKLTGREPGRLVKPDIEKDMPQALDDAIRLAEQNNPAIIAAKFEEGTARYEVDRIGAGLRPSIDFTARGTLASTKDRNRYVGFGHLSGQNRQTNIGADVTMSVPLYEQGSVRAQKREAHDRAAGARVNIESQSRDIKQRLTASWQNYLAARANIESYKKQVKASQISLEGTEQEVQVGTKIILDVLNSQKDLLNSQLNLVRAERTYLLEGFSILQWIGRLTAKQLKLKVNHYDPSVHYNNTRGRF